jgi:Family of unknown function (DUF6527)
MSDKFHEARTEQGEKWIVFHCPGCDCGHTVPVTGPRGWKWNGSLENPTLAPSLLVNVGGGNPMAPVCHSFVRDGRIQFLSDSTHALARQTVEIPDCQEPSR